MNREDLADGGRRWTGPSVSPSLPYDPRRLSGAMEAVYDFLLHLLPKKQDPVQPQLLADSHQLLHNILMGPLCGGLILLVVVPP